MEDHGLLEVSVSKSKFGQHPVMPWHMVECPKCDGVGWFEKQRSADPQDTVLDDCNLCEGEGEVRQFRAREWIKSQQDTS